MIITKEEWTNQSIVKGFYKDYTLLHNSCIKNGDKITNCETSEIVGDDDIIPLGNDWGYKLKNSYSLNDILTIEK